MNTKIFTKNELSEAAAMIRNGGIVAMPTETVYGLAANAFDAEAVEKVFVAKGRQADNPLIVHIANVDDWGKLVEEIPQKARQLADRFWPGPLTIILKKKPIIPDIVSGGLDTVAVRMPKNKIAFRFIRECGCPLAAPSANLSGCPSPTKFSHVFNDMNGRVDGIIEGGDCMVGVESTVISLVDDKPVILRPGRITAAQISKVIGDVEIHKAVKSGLAGDEKAPSPGMKYKHYSPKASVTIIDGNQKEYIDYIQANADENTGVICFTEMTEKLADYNTFPLGAQDDSVAQAKKLFEVLRAVDDANLHKAFAPMPSDEGVGLAVTNRLLRAAGFNVIKLNEELSETAQKEPKVQKEEKTALNTKKAVKDSKPIIKKKQFVKKADSSDDDVVEVIGLNDDTVPPVENESKPIRRSNKKKEKKNKTANSNNKKPQKEKKEAKVLKPDSEDKKKDKTLELLDETLPVEVPVENDNTINALNNITLSADFNDDFSKEISENILVVNPLDDPSMPVQILPADEYYLVEEEEFKQQEQKQEAETEKKPKKHFFKSIFAKRSNTDKENETDK